MQNKSALASVEKFRDKYFVGISKLIIIFSLLCLFIFSGIFYAEGLIFCNAKINSEGASRFGDFIGGFLGVLVSIASVILIYLTYRSQSKELKETKRTLFSQNFDNSFFQLLQIHKSVREEFYTYTTHTISWKRPRVAEKKEIRKGLEGMNIVYEDFVRLYEYEKQDPFSDTETQEGYTCSKEKSVPTERIKEAYTIIYNNYEEGLSPYFRQLFHLLKYINEEGEKFSAFLTPAELNEKKQFYANILQSQLTPTEMALIFYDGLNYPKLKTYIEKFQLLDNLRFRHLADTHYHGGLYSFKLKGEE